MNPVDEIRIKMQRRPVAYHIMTVVKENKNEDLCFSKIKRLMTAKGWIHDDSNISKSIAWLEEIGYIKRTSEDYRKNFHFIKDETEP